MSEKMWIIILAALVVSLLLLLGGVWLYMRKKFMDFAENIGERIECLIQGVGVGAFSTDEETLDSKIQMKLIRLEAVTSAVAEQNIQQKKDIQKMVSDISHQLKTPIANITMYNDTMLNNDLPKEKEQEFLQVMQGQVEKLDFLVKSLVKMSRLENSLISITKERGSLVECVEDAVHDILPIAQMKNLQVEMSCDEKVYVFFDRKWTMEAVLNVLDNAVKYTPEGGCITISVSSFEMFAKITVSDTGIGIENEHINDVFKRFYRERKVHNQPGIGIGLYLARQIISSQGGYMKVMSESGKGSCFSIYLPRVVE